MVSERRRCIANPLINLLHLAAAQPAKMEGADKEAWTWIPARPHASGLKTHYGRGLHAAPERRGLSIATRMRRWRFCPNEASDVREEFHVSDISDGFR